MLFSLVFYKCAGTEYQNWIENMINDLWSCGDQSDQLLDQKFYVFVSNFTGSAHVCCTRLKIMMLTSIQHTGAVIFFPQRLMVGCFQAFDSIFPLGRRPPTPQPPNNTPRNSCLPPSSGQPPFYKPHLTHIPLISPTKGQHSKHQLYGGKFALLRQLMKPNYHC